jgi:hypothetical protein
MRGRKQRYASRVSIAARSQERFYAEEARPRERCLLAAESSRKRVGGIGEKESLPERAGEIERRVVQARAGGA